MPILAINKKAKFDYAILDKFEAGLVLSGQEVKAIKGGQISLRGSYIIPRTNNGQTELFLIGAQVPSYKPAGPLPDYNPQRERKLLLKKWELAKLIGKKQEQGLTLVPLKIYTNHSFLKLEFAIAKGKKKYDKRETIKKRDIDKRLRSLTKRK
ncbi:MAG: SsrA-binding protein SmpB [Patescibacteria group bacterium]|jgi:SsrA-binding protein|nr:SsrA-binding protein SmpB [Patescibacteria group bacterium]MDD3777985.1 SsrA-binding protein SmpB [Patescibacteria group bacterium]MDD3939199.1 SsrA-binding protein SmpB [Patescibacteria group bacterium]MDD4443489.1 SsrA-binding protein SmpB [Patescibacteria group bacterium]NCU39595.1 SsrA-binding protein SmpB [Candidatus Falkowbacteria bacterium]